MSSSISAEKGLVLLSLDGGPIDNITSLSTALTFSSVMETLESELCLQPGTLIPGQHFDLIAGTGTGGILALFIGPLKMTATEAIHQYHRLHSRIFQQAGSRHRAHRIRALESEIRSIIQQKLRTGNDAMLLSATNSCKTLITTMAANNLSSPMCFRTYPARSGRTFGPTIVQAAQATLADPKFFNPIHLGPPNMRVECVSTCFGYNNPIMQLLDETQSIFSGRSVSCIVSIGAGHPGPISFPISVDKDGRTADAVAAGCEQTAEAASRQFSSADSAYFRFNVQQGLQVRPNRQFTFAQVSAHSRSYTSTMEVKEKVDRLVQVMKERPCIYAVDLLHRPQTTMIFKVPQRTAESVRLQDATNRLPYAQCAYFDPEGGCLPGTRHTLLSTIRDWLDEQDQACHYRVLLVDGPLGSGKSTLTTTIAKEAKQSGLLASAFFLTAGATTDSSLKQNHASPPSIYNLMSTFIRDLAGLSVLFREAVGAELDTHPALLTASPIDQFQRLLVPFVNLLPDRPMLWVIDGYDELRKDANSTDLAHRLLELFQKDVQALDSRFMILIASRPFRHPWFKGPIAPHVTALHIDLTSPSNEVDMVLIAHAELQQVAQLNESFGPEPEQGHETVGQFATRAGGLPLWLRAARKFIQHSFNPRQDLDDIVATPVPTNCSHQEIMDDLYAMCLKSCFDNWSHVSRREQVGQVVDILLSLQRPMNLSTLLELYEHDKKLSSTVVWNVMESFRPVLLRDTPIDFIHSSFRDFLSSETFLKILTVPSFKGQGSFGHCSLLSRSMFVLQHQLPSIREFLDGSGDLSSESKILSLRNLPATSSAALAYCSGTWTTHFLSTPEIAGDVLKQLHEFLNGSFKRWVEFETFFGVLPIDQQFMKNVLQRFEDEGGRLALFPYLQHQATGTLLHRLAIHLQSSGRFQEASDASELATTIIAPLVQCGDILPKDLATALATLSGSQARLERDQDATRSKGLAVKLSQESKHSDVVNRLVDSIKSETPFIGEDSNDPANIYPVLSSSSSCFDEGVNLSPLSNSGVSSQTEWSVEDSFDAVQDSHNLPVGPNLLSNLLDDIGVGELGAISENPSTDSLDSLSASPLSSHNSLASSSGEEADYDTDSDSTIEGVTQYIPGQPTPMPTRSATSALAHQADGKYKQALDQVEWGLIDDAFVSVGEAVGLYRQALKVNEQPEVASKLAEVEDLMKDIQNQMYPADWVAGIGDQIEGIKKRVWGFVGF